MGGMSAFNAKESLDRELKVKANLTRAERKCGDHVGCHERMARDRFEVHMRLKELLRALRAVIPPDLLNVTAFMRRIPGLQQMADTSDDEFQLEESRLQQYKLYMEDCGSEQCVLKYEEK